MTGCTLVCRAVSDAWTCDEMVGIAMGHARVGKYGGLANAMVR